MRKPILFFKLNKLEDLIINSLRDNEEQFTVKLFKPSLIDSIFLSKIKPIFIVWFLFKFLGFFKNPYYIAFLYNRKKEVVHHFVLLPKCFKYPFMEESDLQIGDVWTRDDYRGHNISSFLISKVLKEFFNSGQSYWYLTELENHQSIRVAKKLNFQLHAEGWLESKIYFLFLKTNIYNI